MTIKDFKDRYGNLELYEEYELCGQKVEEYRYWQHGSSEPKFGLFDENGNYLFDITNIALDKLENILYVLKQSKIISY